MALQPLQEENDDDEKADTIDLDAEEDDPHVASNYLRSVLPTYFNYTNWGNMDDYQRKRFNSWGKDIHNALVRMKALRHERKKTHEFVTSLQMGINSHDHGDYMQKARAIMTRKVTQLQSTTTTPTSVFILPPQIQAKGVFAQVFFRLISANGSMAPDSIHFRHEVFLKNCDTSAKLLYSCTLMSETLGWFYGLVYDQAAAANLLNREQSLLVKAIGKANPELRTTLAGFDAATTSNPSSLFKHAIALLQRTSLHEVEDATSSAPAKKRVKVDSLATGRIAPCKFGRHCVKPLCDFNHDGDLIMCQNTPCRGPKCGLAHAAELSDPTRCLMLAQGLQYSAHRSAQGNHNPSLQQSSSSQSWTQQQQGWQSPAQPQQPQQRQQNYPQQPQQRQQVYSQQPQQRQQTYSKQPQQRQSYPSGGQGYTPERKRILKIIEQMAIDKRRQLCHNSYTDRCSPKNHSMTWLCAQWNKSAGARRCPKFDKDNGCWDAYLNQNGCSFSHSLN